MRFTLISDMHVLPENENRHFISREELAQVDLLVVAGDVCNKARGVRTLRHYFGDKPILYVLGNHERYGEHVDKAVALSKEAALNTNVRVLDREAVVLGDVVFVGATLWTNLLLNQEVLAETRDVYYRFMNDYRCIKRSGVRSSGETYYSTLRPIDTQGYFYQDIDYIQKTVDKYRKDGYSKFVVITHHAPIPHTVCRDPRTDEYLYAPFYASDLTSVIQEMQPDFWCHGHTHTFKKTIIGKTQVICNPSGYHSEPTTREPLVWSL